MEEFFVDLSIVFVISALLAAVAVMFKQPIILAYIACGILVGPWGIGWIHDVHFLEVISHLGITLLLFLAGLCLHPQKLLRLFEKTAWVTLVNCVISFGGGFLIAYAFRFSLRDSLFIGLALMFSSTILVIKLLPTTELHHRRMGAFCIGVLILQDLIAVGVFALIRSLNTPGAEFTEFIFLSLKIAVFIGALIAFEYYVLRKVMAKVDQLHEALFILGLAWCFGVATISHNMGLFHETGAFFSGVVLARHKISTFISEELKPLRDFFLVLFFFTLGARLDLTMIQTLIVVSAIITLFIIFVRPLIFSRILTLLGEKKPFAQEAGFRMGQLSEFSLLIAFLALEEALITHQAAQLIQIVTLFTFIASSYIVFRKYPTPIGVSGGLMKD